MTKRTLHRAMRGRSLIWKRLTSDNLMSRQVMYSNSNGYLIIAPDHRCYFPDFILGPVETLPEDSKVYLQNPHKTRFRNRLTGKLLTVAFRNHQHFEDLVFENH